jgi:uncharacterized protein YcbK (DUF882 family)
MSAPRTTLMLIVPGRRTLSLELGPRWPAALIGALCMPLLMGTAAQRCAHSFQLDLARVRAVAAGVGAHVRVAVAATDVTGSLVASTRPSPPIAAPPQRKPEPPRVQLAAAVEPLLAALAPSRALAASMPAPAPRPAPSRVLPPVDGLAPGWLRVQALHLGESLRVRPFGEDGTADPAAFAALSHLMRCRITGREVDIDQRLIRVLAQISAAYDRPIQLVSGHRQPHVIGTSSTSQHTLGKAADIRVAGVAVQDLRDLAIKLGARGVGLYPEKGFVHVDVRDRKYHWTYTQAGGEMRDPN